MRKTLQFVFCGSRCWGAAAGTLPIVEPIMRRGANTLHASYYEHSTHPPDKVDPLQCTSTFDLGGIHHWHRLQQHHCPPQRFFQGPRCSWRSHELAKRTFLRLLLPLQIAHTSTPRWACCSGASSICPTRCSRLTKSMPGRD